MNNFIIRDNLQALFPDIYTSDALSALAALAPFNKEIKEAMVSRINRRAERHQNNTRISFLDPGEYIPRTQIKVRDAREGKFEGAPVPQDLQRQWIQGFWGC